MTFSPLNAIIDEDAAARRGWTLPALAEAYLSGGARFLQIRSKHAPSGALLQACDEVIAAARRVSAIVIVNDRADIAALSRADGVHVGQDDLSPSDVRRILGGFAVVGLSTHSIEQARAATREAVDYIAVGPVFATSTKDAGHAPVGTALVSEVRAMLDKEGIDKPIVAIGGITLDRAPEVIRAGATSVAVIADLLATGNPDARIREYLGALSGARPERIR